MPGTGGQQGRIKKKALLKYDQPFPWYPNPQFSSKSFNHEALTAGGKDVIFDVVPSEIGIND